MDSFAQLFNFAHAILIQICMIESAGIFLFDLIIQNVLEDLEAQTTTIAVNYSEQ